VPARGEPREAELVVLRLSGDARPVDEPDLREAAVRLGLALPMLDREASVVRLAGRGPREKRGGPVLPYCTPAEGSGYLIARRRREAGTAKETGMVL
jgi:hypothetical protein